MEKNDTPFPQADDIGKILKIINVNNESDLSNTSLMEIYLGDVCGRQVSYYISACKYLGLLDKNKKFTEIGNKIRREVAVSQKIELARIIVSNELFGKIYFTQKLMGIKLDINDVVDIMKEYVQLNSEELYKRRAQTVVSWINWINENEMESE